MKKVAIITGADGGMGQVHTQTVALAGYHVIMACHHADKAQHVCDRIRKETDGDIEVIQLDLASFSSIYAFAKEIKTRFNHLDLLLNNAGTLLHHAGTTADGIERTVGVNYLGHYLLTQQLKTMMPNGSRIVNMVSLTFRFGKINHDLFTPVDQKHFNRFTTYSDSKLALLYFTLDMAQELNNKGILVNCADPGIVNTNIIRMGNKVVDKLCDWFFRPIIYQPPKGASTMLYLALDENVTTTGGCYARKKQVKLKKELLDSPYRPLLKKKTDKIIEKITNNLVI